MCLIVDANVAAEFLPSTRTKAATLVLKWLASKKGKLAIGGKLTGELAATKFRALLVELDRQGAVKRFPESAVNRETAIVRGTGQCVSNDAHVIALARVSRTRVLFSRDASLGKDFKNLTLLPSPAGKIYKSHTHKKLLDKAPSC